MNSGQGLTCLLRLVVLALLGGMLAVLAWLGWYLLHLGGLL